ncbi:MAG: hypothetical protein EOO01_36260, partial [Chitinophagaceae bacterium]
MRYLIQHCLTRFTLLFFILIKVGFSYAQTPDWTWVAGDKSPNQFGVYGTLNVAAAGNKPGARNAAANWKDAAGNLWLFGGFGYGESGAPNYLN